MRSNKFFEKLIFNLSLACLVLSLTGTKACQEDYELGTQSQTAVPSATETPEATETDDLGTVPVPTNTPTATGTITITITITPTATNDIDVDANNAGSILTELAKLDDSDGKKAKKSSQSIDTSAAQPAKAADGNWLGNAFNEDDSASDKKKKVFEDSDGDGFADWLELEHLTDPLNARVYPLKALNRSLTARTSSYDRDNDGLSNEEEERLGTDASSNDTDLDGFLDGIEVMAGTDPNDAKSNGEDSDGDGVPDALEKEKGSNPNRADSDKDGLSDAFEIALGTNPADPDTDKDGVSDGKEFELGADPVLSDRSK